MQEIINRSRFWIWIRSTPSINLPSYNHRALGISNQDANHMQRVLSHATYSYFPDGDSSVRFAFVLC